MRCLVAHGKYIFRKCFSIWSCVGCKMIFVFILPSNIIFWKIERERVRVRSRPRTKREKERKREREMKKRKPIAGNPWAFDFTGDLETLRHEPIFDFPGEPRAFDPRAFNFADDPKPSTSPESHEPISLSVRFWFLCDFDFCCCGGGVGGGVLVVFLLCGGGFCLLAVSCGFWLPEFATLGWIGVSVMCGVVSVVGINFGGCGLLLVVASDGYLLWFVLWIGIWLWFWNFL